jgi:hypothetical protein
VIEGIWNVWIHRILEEVEKGLQTGVAVALGGRFCGCRKPGQEGKDIICAYGFDLPVAERFVEPGENELIVLERIFFSSSTDGTPGTTG